MLTVGQCASLACLLEASAPKPGNVHRGADFEDLRFTSFLTSAVAIQPAMDSAVANGVGETVRLAVHATRQLVDSNTNLGIVLLFSPLACVPRAQSLREGIGNTLSSMHRKDADLVYDAIRSVNPGGLGDAAEFDIRAEAPADLLTAMGAAADRDMVARQYTRQYQDVFDFVLPEITSNVARGLDLTSSIVRAHIATMARYPDSLIQRKCGVDIARESALRAAQAMKSGEPYTEDYHRAVADLDFWLRSDGHRRNPGTTADLIATGLFAALREGLVLPPFE